MRGVYMFYVHLGLRAGFIGRRWVGIATLVATLTLASAPGVASAQTVSGSSLTASPKGTIGLGLIGAELGAVVPALFHYREYWAYIVGPGVGAAGGALLGWYYIDKPDRNPYAVGSLVLGIALIVPSVIITVSGTRYSPNRDFEDPDEPDDAPGEELSSAERDAARQRRIARAGSGLLRLSAEGLLVGLPGFSALPVYARADLALYGGTQRTEFRFDLFSGSF